MQETPYIDVHTHHLQKVEGVISVVNYCTGQLGDSVELHNSISMGLHPWHIEKEEGKTSLERLKKAANKTQVIAIGEIGLDRIISTPLSIQEEFFRDQVEIAEELNKAVIIHCVKCFSELLSLKKRLKPNTDWIIHGYRNNQHIAQSLLAQNCFISFGEALLFDIKVQNIFKALPLNRIFLETDESNHSVIEIYNKAAEIKNIQIDELKETIFKSFTSVFKLREIDRS
ncbi:TatD family hydrolase [Ancylomarina sp. DW003]|nr:TatD family hydrolase [Ancylomarina sp. DW003]MDE5421568.1 TatD family hydrolase [Ancylomarina sp. DW003]